MHVGAETTAAVHNKQWEKYGAYTIYEYVCNNGVMARDVMFMIRFLCSSLFTRQSQHRISCRISRETEEPKDGDEKIIEENLLKIPNVT